MKRNLLIFLLISILAIISVSFALFLINNSVSPEDSEIIPNAVISVIDGDTFEIYNSSENIETIRLLCVNTPEKNQTGYEEAKYFLETLISNNEVILIKSITDKDIYGRSLRYVYVNDSGNLLFVNKLILDNGYGELLIIPPEECEEMK